MKKRWTAPRNTRRSQLFFQHANEHESEPKERKEEEWVINARCGQRCASNCPLMQLSPFSSRFLLVLPRAFFNVLWCEILREIKLPKHRGRSSNGRGLQLLGFLDNHLIDDCFSTFFVCTILATQFPRL